MGEDRGFKRLRLIKFIALFAALLALLFQAGCAANLSHLRDSSLPERAEVKNLTAFEQKENLCGPSALATLLLWAGEKEAAPGSLAPLVYTPGREGTFLFDLAREIRLRGYLAYKLEKGLKGVLAEIAAGNPVLVLENRGLSIYPAYHYSVAGGYDLGSGEILLYEGESEPLWSSLSTFSRTFSRAGEAAILALPPGVLPASGSPASILEALSDLESAGRPAEAGKFYESFAGKFPENWLGRFALGNSLAAGGDLKRAKEEFLAARALAPERPEILNNLALLADKEGDRAGAEALAREAVEKAKAQGIDPAPYEETLEEVLK